MIKTIFISRDLAEVKLLAEFCTDHSIKLHASSLINFEGINNEPLQKHSIVFFPSIRAAHFYLKNNSLEPSVLIGCIGDQTKKKLEDLGLTVSFCGDQSGDPHSVARDFKEWLQGRTVLIPCSNVSLRTIAKELDPGQSEELVVYKTTSKLISGIESDVYIFSSPSNVHSFFDTNTIPEGAILISWGKSTDAALISHGFHPHYTLKNSSEEELLSIIKKLL